MAVESIAPGAVDISQGEWLQPEISQTADALANNPMRSLLVLAQFQAYGAQSVSEYAAALNRAQGTPPPYPLDRNDYSTIETVLEKVLRPAEIVESSPKIGARGKTVRGYTLRHAERSAAVAGTLLDWELQFPGHSLALLLGDLKPGVDEGMPTSCLRMYHALLNQPEGFETVYGLFSRTGRARRTTERIIGTLQERNIITKDSKAPFPEREVIIGRPHPRHLEMQETKMRGIMQALYRACMQLRAEGRTRVPMTEVAKTLAAWDSSYTIEDLRAGLEVQIPSYFSFGDRGKFGANPFNKTRLELSEFAYEAVADLVFRIQLLRDPAFHRLAIERGKAIMWSQADVAYLMNKARHRMKPERTDTTANNAVRSMASLTLKHAVVPGNWRNNAACRNGRKDPELFFPIGNSESDVIQADQAKQVCAECPVRLACLKTAVDRGERHGVWGGVWFERRDEELSPTRIQVIKTAVRIAA
ncbi:MAG TPA: WhiB family transcriptional regulator [Candidatus Saccharimonadales bacterium]